MCHSLVSCWSILIPKGKLGAYCRIPTARITALLEISNFQFQTVGENSGSQIMNAKTQFERQFELYNETIQTNQFMYIQYTL